MTSHLEIERKYDVEPGFTLPDLRELSACGKVGEPGTQILVARYFDTEDLRLAARGITLRRREGGPDEGWHLKLPVEADTRRELHAPLGRGEAVPARLSELVAAHTRGRSLGWVATLETRRTVVPLLGTDGDVLAQVADDEVRGQAVSGPGKAWREIEIELGAGSPELLEAAGDRLREAGARPASAASKLGRLLDGALPAPAEPYRGYRTAGDVIMSYMAEQAETILEYDPRVRLAEYDSVHKMRVAVRRIRSILRTGARLLDPERTRPLDAELKWLAGALGEVRDLEVLRERFTGRLAEIGETTPPWMAGLGAEEQTARTRLNQALNGERYLALLDALDAFVADPPLTERASRKARRAASRLVAKAWRRVARDHAELGHAEDLDAARHRVRKAAKRARYTAEAAQPVLGKPASRLAAQAEKVQETLGAYQDSVIARERLTAMNTGGDEAFILGVLTGLERSAAERALRDADEVWKKASKPKYVRALTR